MGKQSLIPLQAAPHVRFVRMVGDTMEPTLQSGDFVAVVPTNTYRAEGLYVCEQLGRAVVFRCQRQPWPGGRIDVTLDNKRYTPFAATEEQFAEMVLGKVAAICKVVDRSLLEGWA